MIKANLTTTIEISIVKYYIALLNRIEIVL